jgi:tape measure domain-containing protein
MPQVDPVILQLRADIREYNTNTAQAVRLADQRLGTIERRGDKMAAGIGKSFSFAARAALSYVAAIGAIDIAKTVGGLADASKNIAAQLKLATQQSGSFAQAQEDVRRVSAATRSDLESTAQLYGNFQRNARDLGITQDDAARATETVAKSFKISGANAVEASQGTRQLVQALQSGVLRGDEFNTIMESSPRLARLFAESLGIPIGQLRAMAEQGQLTSDKLVRALTDTKFTDGIDAEFKQMPVTFDQAMTQIENAAIITFGAFDRGGQFSNAIANFVSDGAKGFADLESDAESFGRSFSIEMAGAIANAEAFWRMLKSVGDQLGINALLAAGGGGRNIASFVSGALNPVGGLKLAFDQTVEARNARAGKARQLDYAASPFAAYYSDYLSKTPSSGAPPPASVVKPHKGSNGPSAETLARRAEAERVKAIREDAAKERDLSQLQDDVIAARSALATASEDILTYQLQEIDSDRAQRMNRIAADQKLQGLSDAEVKARTDLVDEIVSARRAAAFLAKADADNARIAAENRDEIDTQKAEADLLTSRQARAAAEKRILDLTHKEEEAAIRLADAKTNNVTLEEDLARMRRRQAAENRSLELQGMSPLDSYRYDLGERGAQTDDLVEGFVVDELKHVQDTIASAISKVIGTKDPLITGLINLLVQQVLIRPMADALANAGGGGGILGAIANGVGAIFGASGGKNVSNYKARASGGPVTAGGTFLIGEDGPEILRMGGQSGLIVPNHQLGQPQMPTSVAVVRVELTDDLNARIVNIAGPVAVEVTRLNAPAIADAGAAKALKAIQRPTL